MTRSIKETGSIGIMDLIFSLQLTNPNVWTFVNAFVCQNVNAHPKDLHNRFFIQLYAMNRVVAEVVTIWLLTINAINHWG